MRVLQVLTPAAFGGIEMVVQQLAEGLPRVGVESVVVALDAGPQSLPFVTRLRERGVPLRELARSRGFRSDVAELRRLLAQEPDSVVHSHGYRADLLVALARARQQRWFSTAHGFTHLNARLSAYQIAERLAMRSADGVFAVSAPLVTDLRRWGVRRERLHLVRNVPRESPCVSKAEARQRLGLASHGLVVGWVGRFSHEKGPDRLPEIAAALPAGAELVLVGDGPEREPVLAILEASANRDRCRWLGRRDDIGSLMAAFDLLVLPSRTEGMPLTVLEAMRAGVPVVGFAVGDVSAVLTAETGWLITAQDMAAFAHAVHEAMGDEVTRNTRGAAAARTVATQFMESAWLARHRALYAGVSPPS